MKAASSLTAAQDRHISKQTGVAMAADAATLCGELRELVAAVVRVSKAMLKQPGGSAGAQEASLPGCVLTIAEMAAERLTQCEALASALAARMAKRGVPGDE